jgi:predicted nucleotidyltransferase
MTEQDRQTAAELKARLLAAAGPHIRRILVFGSRAREEPEPDSDLDVAVLVDERTDALERLLDDAVYQLMWDRDFRPVISLKVFAQDEFDALYREGFSFYRNVLREGVVV